MEERVEKRFDPNEVQWDKISQGLMRNSNRTLKDVDKRMVFIYSNVFFVKMLLYLWTQKGGCGHGPPDPEDQRSRAHLRVASVQSQESSGLKKSQDVPAPPTSAKEIPAKTSLGKRHLSGSKVKNPFEEPSRYKQIWIAPATRWVQRPPTSEPAMAEFVLQPMHPSPPELVVTAIELLDFKRSVSSKQYGCHSRRLNFTNDRNDLDFEINLFTFSIVPNYKHNCPHKMIPLKYWLQLKDVQENYACGVSVAANKKELQLTPKIARLCL
ncbi:hypothetical protein NPIL_310121 [Nephila pilipes]|uniref:Uncharacterized protein n=1 Tax=Nephila pilipes TaxID=299642 RepID=A0A8X6PL93_NEPPI|nr:hypothetical protein NPIL_310121 [Nephila pilipes]